MFEPCFIYQYFILFCFIHGKLHPCNSILINQMWAWPIFLLKKKMFMSIIYTQKIYGWC